MKKSELAIKEFEELQAKGLLTPEQDYASFLSGFNAGYDAMHHSAGVLSATDKHWREALKLLRDVAVHGEDAVDQRNGETVKEKCRNFVDKHGDTP